MDVQNKRVEWIDFAKGYGMILVIAGHCFNKENPIHNWIFSFHMPLFFVLSGYCFNPNKYKDFAHILKEKYRRLIKPYILFCMLGLGISIINPEWRKNITIENILVDVYTGYPKTVHITSIWYLIALFVLSVLLYIVLKVANKNSKLAIFPYVFVLLSGFFGYMITIIRKMMLVSEGGGAEGGIALPGGRLPLTLDTCMTALVFFYLGYLWKQNADKMSVSMNKVYWGIIFLVINVVMALKFNSRVNLHGCMYGNILFFYISAVCGVAATCVFSKVFTYNKRFGCIKQIILMYGRESLYVLGMQSLFINILNQYVNSKWGTDYVLYENVPIELGIVYFILISIILVPFSILIKRRYMRWKIQREV